MFNGEFNATGVVPAHAGPVTAMYSSGVDMLTGGADGNVKTWKTKSKITETGCHAFGSGIRSVCSEPGQAMLVGTEKSEIFQVSGRGRGGTSAVAVVGACCCCCCRRRRRRRRRRCGSCSWGLCCGSWLSHAAVAMCVS
jgi:hypothetical protein